MTIYMYRDLRFLHDHHFCQPAQKKLEKLITNILYTVYERLLKCFWFVCCLLDLGKVQVR